MFASSIEIQQIMICLTDFHNLGAEGRNAQRYILEDGWTAPDTLGYTRQKGERDRQGRLLTLTGRSKGPAYPYPWNSGIHVDQIKKNRAHEYAESRFALLLLPGTQDRRYIVCV